MRITGVVMAGAALVVSACGNESGAGGSLDGKSYLSVSVTEDGKAKQLAPSTRIQLQFMDDGRLVANAGCNSMSGQVSTGGGKLAVDDLAITDMGCDGPRHAQDDWFAKLLQDEPSWKLEADKLTVTRGATALVLQDRETAEPDKPLDGTKWLLETVISGETASHSMGSEQAYFTINGERVTGSTGCNSFQGVVSRIGNKLTFGELATTRKACAGEGAALEKAILDGLKAEVTYSIDSNRLKLRTANGNGLDLTAA
jgi:heat shock protein HslJ